ncbi:alpha/beta fold hydrolase [Glaciibacter superstes]|uniref:alpha/beta fold hydrolase n=1 Tax=Glaciibacter superstes TaxID=501023 RepID=UPI0003B7A3A5|nr:alpha/beta hydrolase [Glaciibacter superstes]
MTSNLQARYVEIEGALAFIEDWGEGTPLFCIHTAGQSGVQYRYAAAELALLGYRVIVPDLPGHGRSEPRPGGAVTDLGDYAGWCVSLIEHLQLKMPVIVGCSIGGKISLDVATRMGDRISAIIAMAASAEPGRANVSGLKRELEDIAAPSRTDRTFYGTRAVVGSAVPDEQRDLIARMHCREDPEVSTSDLIGWGSHDVVSTLTQITAPARLVLGTDDLWVDPKAVERTAAGIDGAEFTYLNGVGHYPMEEMPDFAQFIHQWLARSSISTATEER